MIGETFDHTFDDSGAAELLRDTARARDEVRRLEEHIKDLQQEMKELTKPTSSLGRVFNRLTGRGGAQTEEMEHELRKLQEKLDKEKEEHYYLQKQMDMMEKKRWEEEQTAQRDPNHNKIVLMRQLSFKPRADAAVV